MLDRCFAVVCDAGYFPGLRALLNSVWTYHGDAIPVFLYQRGLNESQLAEVRVFPFLRLPLAHSPLVVFAVAAPL